MVRIHRLTPADRASAKRLFVLIAQVFGEDPQPLGDDYVDRLLNRDAFWAFAAFHNGQIVGGLTAHTLPMTRAEYSEVFIYDIAVHADHQRKGIGRQLVAELRAAAAKAGINDIFVPADNEDTHALDFYHALGGEAAAVTIFSFSSR